MKTEHPHMVRKFQGMYLKGKKNYVTHQKLIEVTGEKNKL